MAASRGMSITGGVLTGLVSAFAMLCFLFPHLLPIAIIAVVALLTHHVSRIHRRLDAMTELFHAEQNDHDNSV